MDKKKQIMLVAGGGSVILIIMIVAGVILFGSNNPFGGSDSDDDWGWDDIEWDDTIWDDIEFEDDVEPSTQTPQTVMPDNVLRSENYSIEQFRDFIYLEKMDYIVENGIVCRIQVEYKGTKFIQDIPYSIYKEMPEKGIVVADIEAINYMGRQTIVYIKPLVNYKDLLNGGN